MMIADDPFHGGLMRKVFPALPEPEARPRYLKPRRAAEFLGLSIAFLARGRVEGTGPQFIKAGAAIVYDVKDLIRWADHHKRRSTREIPEITGKEAPTAT
jgi:hypothetical protein